MIELDYSYERFRADRRALPRDCRAALVDAEDRLLENPTESGKDFEVRRIKGSVFEYEQFDPHLRVHYEYDEAAQCIRFIGVRTMAFEDPTVFICYSRDDASWVETIRSSLTAFAKSKIDIWSDHKLEPDDKWDEEIRGKLASALAALLLLSESFFESQYIQETELPILLRSKRVKLLWLKVGPCDPSKSTLGVELLERQAVADPGKPLAELPRTELRKRLEELEQWLLAVLLDPLLKGLRP